MSRKSYRPRGRTSRWQSDPTILAAVAITFVAVFLVAVLVTRGPSTAAAAGGTGTPGLQTKSAASNSRPSVTLPSNINKSKVQCGAACDTLNPGWVSVPVASSQQLATPTFATAFSSTIASTISRTGMFTSMESHYGTLQTNTPMLVHPYGPVAAGASDYFLDDHWVVAVNNAQGQECGIFDFVYDSAHNRIRFSSYSVISPRDTEFYGKPFPFTSATSAETQVHSAARVTLMSGAAPELIFFPEAWTWKTTGAPKNWTAGGTSPMDPIWLMPGADGQSYFVGTNMKVYTQQELPLTAG